MKNKLFVGSFVLNVILAALCLYLSWDKVADKTNSLKEDTQFLLSQNSVNDGDVVFLGEDRLAGCDWSAFLGDEACKTLAFKGNNLDDDSKRLALLFPNVTPRKIFMMYGEQELLQGMEVGEFVDEYSAFLSRIQERFPSTEVVLLSVLPMWKEYDNQFNLTMSRNIKTLNVLLKLLADQKGYPFLNLYSDFVDAEGNMDSRFCSSDGAVLKHSVYVIMKDRIKDYVKN